MRCARLTKAFFPDNSFANRLDRLTRAGLACYDRDTAEIYDTQKVNA